MNKLFVLATPQEYAHLSEMIKETWHSAYDDLLGAEQVDYMTDKFQSASAIEDQVKNQNYIYFYIVQKRKKIGYCAVVAEADKLFLSKLYLVSECRGAGDRSESACGCGGNGKKAWTFGGIPDGE